MKFKLGVRGGWLAESVGGGGEGGRRTCVGVTGIWGSPGGAADICAHGRESRGAGRSDGVELREGWARRAVAGDAARGGRGRCGARRAREARETLRAQIVVPEGNHAGRGGAMGWS